jgi:ABC-type dipeptide/oligopeptide/nickel transport system permease subunit
VTSRLRAFLGAGIVLSLVLAAGVGLLASAAPWARALWATLADSAIVLAVALLLGLPFGFVAGSGVRVAETALGRAVELAAALPAVLFAAAALQASGNFVLAAVTLGLVRAVELGWLLRGRIFVERQRLRLAGQSQARLPFSVYYRRALPRALEPGLVAAALTPVWVSLVDASAVALSITPLESRLSLGTAAARGSVAALLAVALFTLALYEIARYTAGRLALLGDEEDDEDHDDDEDHEPIPLSLRRPSQAPESSG